MGPKRTRNREAELKRELFELNNSYEERLARKDIGLRKALNDLDKVTNDLNSSFEERRLEMGRAEDTRRDLERKLEQLRREYENELKSNGKKNDEVLANVHEQYKNKIADLKFQNERILSQLKGED